MELFFTDRRGALASDGVPGIDSVEVHALFERRLVLDGMPVLLDRAMRPVEPLSSWFRHLALAGRSPKTMRKYAYMVLRLMDFLGRRGADLASATETDLLEYRALRSRVQDEPVSGATWEVEASAINGLYAWLAEQGHVSARPWRATGGRDSLRGSISRDMMVRHMTLEQYLFLRDVGLAGQTPDAAVERSFRGRLPHRSRAGVQLALLTGMRLGEWSTVLLPELGLDASGRARGPVEFGLSACAKLRRPRQVYVPQGAIDMLVPYLRLERQHLVTAAQRSLTRRRADLFVVDAVQDGRGKLRGVLDGRRVTRSIAEMPAELRQLTVMDTGTGLEPLAVFVGAGGQMPHPSTWDKLRWRAWERLRGYADHPAAPVRPARPWRYHDLRHTFALRLLLFLMQQAIRDGAAAGMAMSTLVDHVAYNPLMVVQRRLGHASPATTYIYLRYLKDPMRDVDEAFRAWAEHDSASYAEIGRHLLSGSEAADAPQR